MPGRKIICKACGNPIYKRTHPKDQVPVLANEAGRISIGQKYAEMSRDNDLLRIAREYCTEEEIERQRRQLGSRFGQEPTSRDVAWGAINQTMLRQKDLHIIKMLHFSLARVAYQSGEPFMYLLKEVHKYQLYRHKKDGVKLVEILSCECDMCKIDNGKVFTITEALERMPIPHSDCAYSYGDFRPGWCKCCWVAKLDQ